MILLIQRGNKKPPAQLYGFVHVYMNGALTRKPLKDLGGKMREGFF